MRRRPHSRSCTSTSSHLLAFILWICSLRVADGQAVDFPAPCLDLPDLSVSSTGWQVVPFDTNDTSITEEGGYLVDLPFAFSSFGNNLTSLYIHRNGFLYQGDARFNVLNSHLDLDSNSTGGRVWYQVTSQYLSVVWYNVSSYYNVLDTNTFQALLTDGTYSLGTATTASSTTTSDGTRVSLGPDNVAFCYTDLDIGGWVSLDSFGHGGAWRDVIVGFFHDDDGGSIYDGPGMEDDSITALEDSTVVLNIEKDHVPPFAVGFPMDTIGVSNCDGSIQLHFAFHSGGNYDYKWLTVHVDIVNEASLPEGMEVSLGDEGSHDYDQQVQVVTVTWDIPTSVAGLYSVVFNATDDAPDQAWTVMTLTFDVTQEVCSKATLEDEEQN